MSLEVEALMAGYDVPSLIDLIYRPAWMRDALCREPAYADVSFFPGQGEATEPAKAVCARCTVAEECLAYVTTAGDGIAGHGIWGGTSARERRQHRPIAA
jgi:WhiB family redox-sensing transcriptional regulator